MRRVHSVARAICSTSLLGSVHCNSVWFAETGMMSHNMIRFRCPGCSAKLNAKFSQVGRSFACPQCGQSVTVPGEISSEQPDAVFEEAEPSGAESFDEFPDLQDFVREEAVGEVPPAPVRKQKRTARTERSGNDSKTKKAGAKCGGCGKLLEAGQRFCVACGFNNFDADAAAVEIHVKLANRLENLANQLIFLRWLKIFARFLR